jgi:hypothetical protein
VWLPATTFVVVVAQDRREWAGVGGPLVVVATEWDLGFYAASSEQ